MIKQVFSFFGLIFNLMWRMLCYQKFDLDTTISLFWPTRISCSPPLVVSSSSWSESWLQIRYYGQMHSNNTQRTTRHCTLQLRSPHHNNNDIGKSWCKTVSVNNIIDLTLRTRAWALQMTASKIYGNININEIHYALMCILLGVIFWLDPPSFPYNSHILKLFFTAQNTPPKIIIK